MCNWNASEEEDNYEEVVPVRKPKKLTKDQKFARLEEAIGHYFIAHDNGRLAKLRERKLMYNGFLTALNEAGVDPDGLPESIEV